MRNYFKRKKVNVLELRVKPYIKGEPLSVDCAGPRGDTAYVLIRADDAPKMVGLGYTERLPAKDVPNKK